ncbi:DUF1285 domain-containing protein [Erythrobacteraceae bacterium CFH 75059]|uniref:DUF1285 domain-containing protein n=1 Tax=Qipengyuania thermophila TaxID=2509361 RepID=UPI00101FFB89|nr:DUF1285 domain-containing protein [Qipengyuania thermophila]TCD02259.1 DUF1285 domain-containing protein [Erythrobacteraceae bacterium CFH 75059]
MPYQPPPELASLSLSDIADLVAQRRLPAVEGWAPQARGDSRMRIAADGQWFHDGAPITRPAMVRAFSGLLSRDDEGQHWLVTPFEKLSIAVEDAPFVAVDVVRREGDLAFRLNTDDLVVAGPDHALLAEGDADHPRWYVHVRRGCLARLNRSTFDQLAQIALEEGDDWTVTSKGAAFALRPA